MAVKQISIFVENKEGRIKKAIDTLLKRLEDDRGKFICIVAGYTDQMHDFIDTNHR